VREIGIDTPKTQHSQACAKAEKVHGTNLAMISWLFVTFGDSGSWKQNGHERGESGELENPCESMKK
jgi:hypothetical protein